MQEIKKRIFPFIIALSALSVSASAAYYSVTGLSKLFAGASTQVMVMAGSLEVAKLVIASLLYQYWNELNKVLRTYLVVAATVLILITSIGIYGYLSAAYQTTASQAGNAEAQVVLLETKKQNFVQQRDLYAREKDNLVKGIEQLQTGLSNSRNSRVDKRGNLIQSSDAASRKSFERQLDNSTTRQSEVSTKLDELNNKIFELDSQIVETRTGNDKAGELGPLKYISTLTGTSMDRIINWLLLIIVFVFDPLAIALVIAANFAFSRITAVEKKQEEHFIEEIPEEEIKVVLEKIKEEPQDKEEERVEEEIPQEGKKYSPGRILRKQPNKYLVDLGNGVQEWMRKRDYFKRK
jgi:hypothetical protein